jgi:flagellar basal body-associated protein FliL
MQIKRPKFHPRLGDIGEPRKPYSAFLHSNLIGIIIVVVLVVLVIVVYLGYTTVSNQAPANYLVCPKGDWQGPLSEAIPVSTYVYSEPNHIPIALQITLQCPNDHTNITTISVPLPTGGS